jgi:hypothetical protein
MPPSLRFLGRKVYLAAVVVLVAIMRDGATTSRLERLSQAVGGDRRTVERWRPWWHEGLTATPFWRVARASYTPPIDHGRLPASLLERFTRDDAVRLRTHSIAALQHPHRMLVADVSRSLLRLLLSGQRSAGMIQQARCVRVHERWAHLRFFVIGELLAAAACQGQGVAKRISRGVLGAKKLDANHKVHQVITLRSASGSFQDGRGAGFASQSPHRSRTAL